LLPFSAGTYRISLQRGDAVATMSVEAVETTSTRKLPPTVQPSVGLLTVIEIAGESVSVSSESW
jgi:hypothetical protein